jgi:hypothetical protein
MRLWAAPRCPVSDEARAWIDAQFAWLSEQFGAALLRNPVVLPTADYFPASYSGSAAELTDLIRRLCKHMDVDPSLIETERFDSAEMPYAPYSGTSLAGDWGQRNGKTMIGLRKDVMDSPRMLVAVIAHELAHQRLDGEGRVDASRRDREQLTDLATVYFGLGIFTANAALEFQARVIGSLTERAWSAQRLGYLDERMYGYALARYASLRLEPDPSWARYLDTNPRSYLRQGARYLRAR